jgi:hypothetical protein
VPKDNLDFVLDACNCCNAGERKPAQWYFHDEAAYQTSSSDPD